MADGIGQVLPAECIKKRRVRKVRGRKSHFLAGLTQCMTVSNLAPVAVNQPLHRLQLGHTHITVHEKGFYLFI